MNKKILKILFFLFVIIELMSINFAENVCLNDIVYSPYEKIFKVNIKNYENYSSNGEISLNFSCDTLNYSLHDNITINAYEEKEITYSIEFCTCNVSANLKFDNNKCKKNFMSKKFESVEVEFNSLTTYVNGSMNFDSKFSIFDNNKKIYEGETINKKFSFKLPNIGKFLMKVDYCNKTVEFSTKHKINIFYDNAEEGKNLTLYVKDENDNPISNVNVYKFYNNLKFLIGKTNIHGFITLIPNETFQIFIDETPYNYNFSKIIYVKSKPSIEIYTFPAENYTTGEILIDVTYNNSRISNVSIEIINPEGNITKFITDDNSIRYIAKIPGIYKIYAKKENFKDSLKEITVYGKIYANFSPEKIDVNDTMKIKVYEINEKINPMSNAIVKIITENLTRIDKTDIDGELKFKVPDVNKFQVCIEKEYFPKICKEMKVQRELNFKLSNNYISENRYYAFENLTIIPYSKGIPIILDKVVVIALENFTIYPNFAKFIIPLNYTGKYEIYGYKEGYAIAYAKIFVEKRDIDVYLYIKDNFLTINFSEELNPYANEILIKNLNNNKTKKFTVLKNLKINAIELGDGSYEILIPEQYNPKFYVNNVKASKFKIEKVYDYTWLSVSIIMILLLSTLAIIQEKYKK